MPSHRRICAAIEGPYQSPALFPVLLPNSTSLCIPNGAEGWSANHDTTHLCEASVGLSRQETKLSFRPLLLGLFFKVSEHSALSVAHITGRSMSSLTAEWLTERVQPQNDVKVKKSEYCTTSLMKGNSYCIYCSWLEFIISTWHLIDRSQQISSKCETSINKYTTQPLIIYFTVTWNPHYSQKCIELILFNKHDC